MSAGSLLDRAQLIDGLTAAMTGCRVALLSAPAGSGKTTAAVQWSRASVDPVGWLSLAPEDDDPHRVVTLAAAAVATADPRLGGAFDDGDDTVPERLNRLFGVLDDQPKVSLVLDDYQMITGADTHRAVADLVEHSPSSLRILVLSRSRPELPLSRWRVRRILGEVDPALLTLRVGETAQLLRLAGVELSDEAMAALHANCEGWLAATVLAASAFGDRSDPGRLARALATRDRHIDDYLLDEVLAAEPRGIRRLLAELSIVDRFTGDLASVITGRRDATEQVERLYRANALIVAVDGEDGRWYRFHHLLRRLLAARLASWSATDAATLHNRACRWFLGVGLHDEAIDHALAARDWDQAVTLLGRRQLDRLDPAELRRFLDWVDAMPPSARTPGLVQAACDANFWHGDRFLGDPPTGRPRRRTDSRNRTVADLAIELIQVSHDGDVSGAVAVGRGIRRAATDPVTLAAGVVAELIGTFLSGQPGVDQILAKADELPEFPELSVSLATVRAWRAWNGANAVEVRRQLDLALAHESLLEGPVAGHALALHSRLLVEEGRLTEAEDTARRLAERSAQLALPGHEALAWAQVAHTLVAAGRIPEAAEPGRRAVAALARCRDPGPIVRAWITEACTAAGVAAGDLRKPAGPLSAREREFLGLLATDLPIADIAARLFVSVNTAKTHRRAVYAKLGVADRATAVELGHQLGLI